MKKLFTLLIACVSVLILSAETRTISCEGKSQDDKELDLQKVVITNVTQNWTVALTDNFSMNVESEKAQRDNGGEDEGGSGENSGDQEGGDNGNEGGGNNDQSLGQIYGNDGNLRLNGQNPFYGTTQVKLNLEQQDNVQVGIVDLSGRLIYRSAAKLEAGEWNLNVSVQMPQLCFLTVLAGGKAMSIKLMNIGFAPLNDISVLSSSKPIFAKISQSNEATTYKCKEGDEMVYQAWTVQEGVTYGDIFSDTWSDKNKVATFRFALLPIEEEDVEPESGMYLGIIGFNNDFYYKDIVYLTKSTQTEFVNTIIDTDLQNLKDGKYKNGTLLYEADWRALDRLQNFKAPKDLANASIVTFTDGEDRGSYNENEFFANDDNGNRYEDSLKYRIANEAVDNVSIKAYAIGKKGSDVASNDVFQANLKTISSGDGYWYPVNNMNEVNEKFESIANDLYKVNIISDVTLSSVPYNNTTNVCWTFDIDSALTITDWSESTYRRSSLYITAEFGKKNGKYYLAKINCVGLTYDGWNQLNPDTIWGVKNELKTYDFTFKNVRVTAKDQAITEVVTDMRRMTRQWKWEESTSMWHKESEFSGNNMKDSEINTQSAVVMLVLDCSSSLSATDFAQLKTAAKNFVNILSKGIKEETTEDSYRSITIAQAKSLALGMESGDKSKDLYRIELGQGWAYDVTTTYSEYGYVSFYLVDNNDIDQDGYYTTYIKCSSMHNWLDGQNSTEQQFSSKDIIHGDEVQVLAKIKNNNGEPELINGGVEKIQYLKIFIKTSDTGNWVEMTRQSNGTYIYYGNWNNADCSIAYVEASDENALVVSKSEISYTGYDGDYCGFTYDPETEKLTVSKY